VLQEFLEWLDVSSYDWVHGIPRLWSDIPTGMAQGEAWLSKLDLDNWQNFILSCEGPGAQLANSIEEKRPILARDIRSALQRRDLHYFLKNKIKLLLVHSDKGGSDEAFKLAHPLCELAKKLLQWQDLLKDGFVTVDWKNFGFPDTVYCPPPICLTIH